MKKFLATMAAFTLTVSPTVSAINFSELPTTEVVENKSSKDDVTLTTFSLNQNQQAINAFETDNDVKKRVIEIETNLFKGTLSDWEKWSRIQVKERILTYRPDAILGKDFFINYIMQGNYYEIRTIPYENVEEVNFRYIVVEDISRLYLNPYHLDDERTTKQNIEDDVNNLISNFVSPINYDFNDHIIDLEWNGNFPRRVGEFVVRSRVESRTIIRDFSIQIIKKLDTSKYQTRGRRDFWMTNLVEIEAEIKQWYPNSSNGVDYEIIQTGNHYQIKNKPGAFVEVDYSFEVIDMNISDLDLELIYDVDSPGLTVETITQDVVNRVEEILPNAKFWIDYRMDRIPSDANSKPTKVGYFGVYSTPNSKETEGSFDILLQKYIKKSDYLTMGSKKQGEETLEKIVAEIFKWNPLAKEDVDYIITYDFSRSGSWTIKSTPNANVIVDISFEARFDLDTWGLTLKYNYWTDRRITVQFIYNDIKRYFQNVSPEAQEGIDFMFEIIPSYANNRPARPNYYRVYATENSKHLVGTFIYAVVLLMY